MKKRKWRWRVDQWFEDNVWSTFPEEDSSPHMFFLIGLLIGFLLSAVFAIIL